MDLKSLTGTPLNTEELMKKRTVEETQICLIKIDIHKYVQMLIHPAQF